MRAVEPFGFKNMPQMAANKLLCSIFEEKSLIILSMITRVTSRIFLNKSQITYY